VRVVCGRMNRTDPNHLKQMAISHFQQLYSEVPVESRPIISYFPALTDEEFHSLSAPILSPEVKQAVDGMAPYKAPGPDGLQAVFYQKSWNTVGQNVVDFFREAFVLLRGLYLKE
jgi:hypothetical protein